MKAVPQVDIRALLLIALDEKPPANLPERVMARVAMLTTVLEFARLLTAAPLDYFTKGREGGGPDDGNDGTGS
ncbi:MAG: hypothetical protein ACOY0T_00470 [Myxococcota bacterium]